MASNLTNQVREIADVTTAVANGDLSRKIHVHAQGEILELQQTINSMVDQLRTFAFEVTRVSREVGIDGILGGQAEIREVTFPSLSAIIKLNPHDMFAVFRSKEHGGNSQTTSMLWLQISRIKSEI